MVITGRVLFNLSLVILMTVLIIMSFNYNPTARSIPIVVASLVLVMSFLQMLGNLFPSFGQRFPLLNQKGIMTSKMEEEEKESEETKENEEAWSKIFLIFAWLLGFLIILLFTHYLISVFLFLSLFIWRIGNSKILTSLSIALGVTVFMYLLFDVILNTRF